MSNYPTFDGLTFAIQADLLDKEQEVEDYLGSGEDYSVQLAEGKDDLLGALLEFGVDPDTLIQDESTAQLKDLHVYYALARIYRREIRIPDDHFTLKTEQYTKLVETEKEKRFTMRGVDQDIDEDGVIDTDSVEEQHRDFGKMQPRVRRV